MSGVWRWFTDGDHWWGPAGVLNRLREHLQLSGSAVLTALVIAVPIGLWLGHRARGGALASNIANIGRAVPTFALVVFAVQLLEEIGDRPAYVALVALAIPPMLTNTYIGVRDVDPEAREAARGMGMSGTQVLARVELPLALPLVLAGMRTAAVQVVATATLAAVVAGGGLGRFIIDGLAQQDDPQIIAGALLVATLSILVELGFALLQRTVTPVGLRPRVEMKALTPPVIDRRDAHADAS